MVDDLGASMTTFDDLYVRSRFGQTPAIALALDIGKDLLGRASVADEAAFVGHLENSLRLTEMSSNFLGVVLPTVDQIRSVNRWEFSCAS